MNKHRLELFSDGVYAIVLTLMVLDLKVPPHDGFVGLREMAPGLFIHLLAFALVGQRWIGHNAFMQILPKVTQRTLWANLVILFFITLIPFGARMAAERPASSLGALTLCVAGIGTNLGFLLTNFEVSDPNLEYSDSQKRFRRTFFFTQLRSIIFHSIAALVSWFSAWSGYFALGAITIYNIIIIKNRITQNQSE